MQIGSINEFNSFWLWLNAAFDALERENDGNTLDRGNATDLKIHFKHEKHTVRMKFSWKRDTRVECWERLKFKFYRIECFFLLLSLWISKQKENVQWKLFRTVYAMASKASLASICLLHAVRKKWPDFEAMSQFDAGETHFSLSGWTKKRNEDISRGE